MEAGSLVFVTGANGFVASHIIQLLLESGYRVRGSVRDAAKVENLRVKWENEFPGKFEAVTVLDISRVDAWEQALRGVAGVVHVASVVSFSPDFDHVVGVARDSTVNLLRAAARTSSVRRFVLTSSVVATVLPRPNGPKVRHDAETWNDEAVRSARGLKEDDPFKGLMTYAASKVVGERAAWEFMERERPAFDFSSVIPAYCIGSLLDPRKQGNSTAGWLRDLLLQKSDRLLWGFLTQGFVSVRDVALLHLGALVLPSPPNARLIASPHTANWNDLLAIFRRLHPDRTTYGDMPGMPRDLAMFDDRVSLEALRGLGQRGWESLEDAVEENVRQFL